MKKYITISLFIFWIIVVTILVSGLIFYDKNKSIQQPTNNQTTLNKNEIAKHNNSRDCWLIISRNVYNVTAYLNMHPAGADAIIPYCGKNATIAFSNKGGKGEPHSNQANTILQSYFIGQINQTVSVN